MTMLKIIHLELKHLEKGHDTIDHHYRELHPPFATFLKSKKLERLQTDKPFVSVGKTLGC